MPHVPQAPRCILFDAVGTLIAPHPPVSEAYHAVGRRHGAIVSPEEIDRRFRAAFAQHTRDDGATSSTCERQRWQQIVAAVFQEPPAAHAAIFAELWEHFSQPSAWRLYNDAEPLLDELRAGGWRLGVASNFDERLVSVCRGHEALAALELFWSSEIGYSKPHPQFFARVAERLRLVPQEILLVGDDAEADVAGARRAGWQALLIDRQATSATAETIQSLAELPRLLASPAAWR